jgi:hypothetical protein
VLEPGVELFFRPDKNIEQKPDLWIATRLVPGEPRIVLRWRVIARLRPGAAIMRAQSQADAAAAHSRSITPTYQGADLHFRLEPMQPYLTSQARPAILALMGAAIFLLLIACSNVANLFLVRASRSARDLAVRTAMGASWWRLARQLLAEALLLGGLGSALGFAFASAGIHDLLSIAPANLPRRDAITIDPAALAFTIAAGIGCSLPSRPRSAPPVPTLRRYFVRLAARGDSPAVPSRGTSSSFPKSPSASCSWSAPD